LLIDVELLSPLIGTAISVEQDKQNRGFVERLYNIECRGYHDAKDLVRM